MFCCELVVVVLDVDGCNEVEDFYPVELVSCRMPNVLSLIMAKDQFTLFDGCLEVFTKVQQVGLSVK